MSPADKAKYDELFTKTDADMDGLVSGPEVRDIFLKTGLPSATLARIWYVLSSQFYATDIIAIHIFSSLILYHYSTHANIPGL